MASGSSSGLTRSTAAPIFGQCLNLTVAQPSGIGNGQRSGLSDLNAPGIEREVGTIIVQPLAAMTWEDARAAPGPGSAAILPVGAIEAHGPHLPLETDVIIAQAMARAGAARLAARGSRVVLLPPLTYTAAPFAQGFAGTLSLRAETVTATVLDIAANLTRHGFEVMAIANAHLDPANLASLDAAVRLIRRDLGLAVAFPNLAIKPWALRLTDEFKSGACHAGQFETSIVLAERPELVREAIRTALPPNAASLSSAIRDGKRTFEEAGGARAYFGFPAQATAEEGRATIETLGAILDDAVQAELGARTGQG
jgi:creatinine amidohydrolase